MRGIYDAILELTGVAGVVPDWIGYTVITLVFALVLALLGALVPIIMVWTERKVSADIQDRIGPNRAGPWGILQSIADAVKLLTKENVTPGKADHFLHLFAPIFVFAGVFAPMVAIPYAAGIVVADLNVGLLYVFSVASFSVIAIIMAGWSSNNKWSLLGAMRSAAQIISYEIPNGLAILTAIVLLGTLNLNEISEMQSGGFWTWTVFRSPFAFAAFFLYIVSSLAEANRTPFDLPEAESELVSGYHTEYSGMRWAMFMMSEYVEMFVINAVMVTIFLGGWASVLPGEPAFGGILWFLGKTAIFMYIGVWIRFTLPRLRVDQLMYTGWKVLIPMAFVTLIGASFQALLGPTGQLVMAVITWLLVAATLIWVVVKARATAHVPRALKRFAAADAVAKV
jgi:NADH-quinone oxidoreductase subunit H